MLYEEVEMVMNGRLGGESFNVVLWLGGQEEFGCITGVCRWSRRLLLSLGFWGPGGEEIGGGVRSS